MLLFFLKKHFNMSTREAAPIVNTVYYSFILLGTGIAIYLVYRTLIRSDYKTRSVRWYIFTMILVTYPLGYLSSRSANMFYFPIEDWSLDFFVEELRSGPHHTFHASMVLPAISYVLLTIPFRLRPLHVMDTIFLFVPLGHAIARIGCLMAGCCYGRVITLSLLGATYTVKNPVPLYEALLNVCLHFVLRAAYRRVYSKPQAGKGDGSIAALYLLGYGTYRMYLETLRVEKVLAYGLTQAQTVMLFFIIVGGSVLIYKAVKKYVFSGE